MGRRYVGNLDMLVVTEDPNLPPSKSDLYEKLLSIA